jgi:hypothetical protein
VVGLTGFVFTVNGRKVEQARTNQPVEPRLVRICLAPNDVRKVRVRTIPLPSSNYPVLWMCSPERFLCNS